MSSLVINIVQPIYEDLPVPKWLKMVCDIYAGAKCNVIIIDGLIHKSKYSSRWTVMWFDNRSVLQSACQKLVEQELYTSCGSEMCYLRTTIVQLRLFKPYNRADITIRNT